MVAALPVVVLWDTDTRQAPLWRCGAAAGRGGGGRRPIPVLASTLRCAGLASLGVGSVAAAPVVTRSAQCVALCRPDALARSQASPVAGGGGGLACADAPLARPHARAPAAGTAQPCGGRRGPAGALSGPAVP
jgi:hypothetical protein